MSQHVGQWPGLVQARHAILSWRLKRYWGPVKLESSIHEVLISNLFRWIKKPVICMLGVVERHLSTAIHLHFSCDHRDQIKSFRQNAVLLIMFLQLLIIFVPVGSTNSRFVLGRIWFTAWPVLLWCLVYWPGSDRYRNGGNLKMNHWQSGFMDPNRLFWFRGEQIQLIQTNSKK